MKPHYPRGSARLNHTCPNGSYTVTQQTDAGDQGLPLVIRTAQLGRNLASLPADRYQTRLAVATDHPTIAEACKAHGVPLRHDRRSAPIRQRPGAASGRPAPSTRTIFSGSALEPSRGRALSSPRVFKSRHRTRRRTTRAGPVYSRHTIDLRGKSRRLQDPNSVKVVCDAAHRALYFSRASIPFPRDGKKTFQFLKHLGVYLWRREALKRFVSAPPSTLERLEKLEQLRAQEMGQRIGVAQGDWRSIDINTEADLLRAEQHLEDIEKQQEEFASWALETKNTFSSPAA